ncbi:efflux RND transporter permease subunit, partial [Klebsiella pneumoniae]|uniref:efflux RND transporter permease subunit n=1 Tax=Klebsiella pneumoniae TaxID=573 RepID=UPI003852AF59
IFGIFLFLRLGGEFLPRLDENAFSVQLVRPVNISLTQAVRLEEMTEAIIKRVPEVQTVFGRLGTSEVATDPMGVNNSDTY